MSLPSPLIDLEPTGIQLLIREKERKEKREERKEFQMLGESWAIIVVLEQEVRAYNKVT